MEEEKGSRGQTLTLCLSTHTELEMLSFVLADVVQGFLRRNQRSLVYVKMETICLS